MKKKFSLTLFVVLMIMASESVFLANSKQNIEKDKPSPEELIQSCEEGNFKKVKELIDLGADINFINSDGDCPLSAAVRSRNDKIAELLIEKGAIANKEWRENEVYEAAYNGVLSVVKLILKKNKVDINFHFAKDYDMTLLHLAVYWGKPDLVKFLLKNGARTEEKEKQFGDTPLHMAARRGDLQSVKYLIEYGANVNEVNQYEKYTPLHCAALDMHYILKNSNPSFLNNKDEKNQEVIKFLEGVENNYEIIKILLQKGANVNAEDEKYATPLYLAIYSENFPCAELLIANGANIDGSKRSLWTPLYYACERNAGEIATLLIQKGANVNVKGINDTTALMQAVLRNNKEICELLISKGAEINARNKMGKTALKIALENGRREIADYLRSIGATE